MACHASPLKNYGNSHQFSTGCNLPCATKPHVPESGLSGASAIERIGVFRFVVSLFVLGFGSDDFSSFHLDKSNIPSGLGYLSVEASHFEDFSPRASYVIGFNS
jgi:hypothetical protein